MKISEVRVKKVQGNGRLKAWVSLTFDDAFRIHGVKVIEGRKGPFVAMPSRKLSTGEYKDTAYPLTQDLREEIQRKVLEEYEKIR